MDIRSIYFRYPNNDYIIKNLSLNIPSGSCVAITGANGSGKSTLCKILAKIISPEKGIIELAKHDRWEQSAFLLQQKLDVNTNFPISVHDFILLSRIVDGHRLIMPFDHQQFNYMLELFQLQTILHTNLCLLSGGQLQRAMIIQSIMSPSNTLIMDEPTQGLDAENIHTLQKCLTSMKKEGRTICIITHSLYLLPEIIDQTFILKGAMLQPIDSNLAKCPITIL